jgi:hypothetical protein
VHNGWVEVTWWHFSFEIPQIQPPKEDPAKAPPTAAQVEALQQRLDGLSRFGWFALIVIGVLIWLLRR